MYVNDEPGFYLGKIGCIKTVRMTSDLGLLEAKLLVDKFFRMKYIERITDFITYEKFLRLIKMVRNGEIVYRDGKFLIEREINSSDLNI